jgi:hypothetical protein
VEPGVHIEVAVAVPDLLERDSLGVAQQPGRLVVQGGRTFVKRPDAKGHPEAATVASHATAGGSRVTAGLARGLDGVQIHACSAGFVKWFTSAPAFMTLEEQG